MLLRWNWLVKTFSKFRGSYIVGDLESPIPNVNKDEPFLSKMEQNSPHFLGNSLLASWGLNGLV